MQVEKFTFIFLRKYSRVCIKRYISIKVLWICFKFCIMYVQIKRKRKVAKGKGRMWQKLRNSLAFIFYETPWMSSKFLRGRFNLQFRAWVFKFHDDEEISLPFIRQSKIVPVFFRSLIEPCLTSSAGANTNVKASRANVDLRSHKYWLNIDVPHEINIKRERLPFVDVNCSIKASSSFSISFLPLFILRNYESDKCLRNVRCAKVTIRQICHWSLRDRNWLKNS